MQEAKNTARALVRIGYDGRVYKQFRATSARERFENEVKVLRYLEDRGCEFVPRIIEANPEKLVLVTTNCGQRVDQISETRVQELFAELEQFGVRHDDPFPRNITYRNKDGRFCVIDFEFATIIGEPVHIQTSSLDLLTIGVPQSIRWSGVTDRGRFRPNNEDMFLCLAFNDKEFHYLGQTGEVSTEGLDLVFAVSDGMGGEKSGEFASRFAIENITRLLPRRFKFTSTSHRTTFNEMLEELFENIHRQLTKLGATYIEGQGMGATLSLVWYVQGWLYFGHIGDSRIYWFSKDGSWRQLSEDHSHVGWLRRSGKINEREARTHPRKNALSQALGAGNQKITPQLGAVSCFPGDRLVLCTDGVIDGLWDRGIEELIRSPPPEYAKLNPAERLVRSAVTQSGRDNASAVVVELRG
jgi:serine/threonine protein phosphatase PrpC